MFRWLFPLLLLVPTLVAAQGTYVGSTPPAIKTTTLGVTPVLQAIPFATITVCSAGDANIPCINKVAIFKDSALTQPLQNPFPADINGNYTFAVPSGNYTVTITASGVNGFTYQVSAGGGSSLINGVPFCTGFTPTNAQVLQYTTTSSPNPCYTAVSNVTGLNSLTGNVSLTAGTGITLTTVGNSIQIASTGGGSVTNPLNSVPNGFPWFINGDVALIGPSPVGTDIRNFNAVSYNPNIAPASGGVTATCNSNTTLNISIPSLFVNGAGIVVQNCGPTTTLTTPSAPTVTTGMARVGEGTGDVTPTGLTGSTAYNYKIVAQGLGLDYTIASASGSIATGPASLGPITTNISSCSQSGNTVTCATSAAHQLVPSAEIKLINNSLSWHAFYNVATVPDTTHFTYTCELSTQNGGTCNFGTTVTALNLNHLTWSAVTGAYRYIIYSDRGSPGTFARIGISKPSYPGSGFTDGSLYFDDFGPGHTTYMTGGDYLSTWTVPLNAPTVATNQALVTTIVSGAGTTTLVLAAPASQTISGVQMRADNAPNIKAAACNSAGSIYFPYTGNYVTNSILDLTNCPVAININNNQQNFNETVIMSNTFPSGITGQPIPGVGSAVSFSSGSYPTLSLGGAPGLHMQSSGAWLRRFAFGPTTNGQSVILVDGGGANIGVLADDLVGQANPVFGGIDDTTILVHSRGWLNNQSGQIVFGGASTFLASQTAVSFTPTVYFADAGAAEFADVFFSGRGPLIQADQAGSKLSIGTYYCQGCVTSLITVASAKNIGSNQFFTLTADRLSNDTSFEQAVSYLQSTGTLNLEMIARSPISQWNYSGPPAGYSIAVANGAVQNISSEGVVESTNVGAYDGVLNTTQAGPYATKVYNAAVSTGATYPFFVSASPMAAPGVALASGGAVPTGQECYSISPVWPSGGDGPVSPQACINVTTGNQTVNLTWTPVVGCTGYRVARGNQLIHVIVGGSHGTINGCTTSSFSDTFGFGDGNASAFSSGGPEELYLGGAASPTYFLSQYEDVVGTTTPANPSTGNCRQFFNSATGQMSFLNSTGGSCAPANPPPDLRSVFTWSEDFVGRSPTGPVLPSTLAFGAAGSNAVNSTALSVTVSISAGTTAFAMGCDASGRLLNITDNGGNTYFAISPVTTIGATANCRLYATAINGALAATTVQVSQPGAAEELATAVYTVSGLRSYTVSLISNPVVNNTALSSGSFLSEDPNDFILSFYGWYSGGSSTLTATTGTARTNTSATVNFLGIAALDNTVAGAGASLSTAATASVSAAYGVLSLELRSTNGVSSTGGYGASGWMVNGPGNTTQLLPLITSTNMFGVLELQTAATGNQNSWAETYWPSSRQGLFSVNNTQFDTIFRVRIPAGNSTNANFFCGMTDLNGTGENTQNMVGIAFSNANSDTNWTAVAAVSGGTETRTSTTIAPDNAPIDLRIRSVTPGIILYSLWRNGAILASEVSISTNVPIQPVAPTCSVAASGTASARFFDIDFSQGTIQVVR